MDKPAGTRLGSVRGELQRLGTRPRKALGQHFLRDASVASRIAALVEVRPGERVIEIGPGLGALTDLLAAAHPALLLVEIDRLLAERARERYAGMPHVEVLCADAVRLDWRPWLSSPAVVVGNLPYNAATAILQRLLEQRPRVRRIVAMVQREVAERLVATPGSKVYGALSILTQLDCEPRVRFVVPPGSFTPPPKVHSAVVTFDTRAVPAVDVGDERRFRALVRATFQHRRKQLANSLRGIVAEPRTLLARLGIDPSRRPETLTMDEIAAVARESRDA